jgi:hypothetical protein
MTEAEIIKSNVLIAEFMGAKYKKDVNFPIQEGCLWLPFHGICRYNSIDRGNCLSYHRWWDWLIPVVEKIESIKDSHDGFYGVYISSNSCCIQGTSLHMALSDPDYGPVYYDEVTLDTKLESTYQVVIRFIKWFNSKQQSENGRGHNH